MHLTRDEASLTTELPYWTVQDGLVILNDGTYEVALEFDLPPTALWPTHAVNHLAHQIKTLLHHAVPEGERVRVMVEAGPEEMELVSRFENSGPGIHPAARLLATSRAAAFRAAARDGRLVGYRAILSCTYHPPGPKRRKMWTQVDQKTYSRHRDEAHLIRRVLLANLERAGLHARPLEDDEIIEVIWRYFNPMQRRHSLPPRVPRLDFEAPVEVLQKAPYLSRPTIRSLVVTSDTARRWNHLWVDDHYLMIVSMDQLPVGETRVGMVAPLLALPYWYWLVLDFVHDPYGPAVRALETQARRLYAQTTEGGPLSDYVDPRVRVGFGEADAGLQHAYSSGSHIYRCGASVVLLSESQEEVREAARRTVDAFGQLYGLKAVVESAGLWQQYLQLAPFSGKENERVFRVFEENAADFFPVSGPWKGQKEPVCLFTSRWDSPVAIDPFDPALPNWNAIVAGASGSGKTFFMQSVLAQLMARGCEAIIVDRGYGYEWLAKAVDAQIIPVDPGKGVSINPFDLPEGAAGPDDDKKAFLLALLRSILPPVDPSREPIENAILESAIIQTYARFTTERRDPQTGEVRTFYEGARLSDLSTVLVTMEEIGTRPMGSREKEIARELAGRLSHWTGESAFAHLLDRSTGVRLDSPVLYFETSALERHRELQAPVLLILSDLIWRRVQANPERRKVVVIDEAWALLGLRQAAQFIGELYRRFRRYGAAVYTVTQSLKDFQGEGARGILENTTFLFLGQLPQELELAAGLFGLPDRAVEALGRLTIQKGVYSEILAAVRMGDRLEGDILVIRPTPEEYWMFTTFDRDVPVRMRAVEEAGGDVIAAISRLAKRA